MHVTLHTACGCTKEVEMAYMGRYIEVPISTDKREASLDYPSATTWIIRSFQLEHVDTMREHADYREVLVDHTCDTCKRAKQLLDTYGMDEGL
jgi:hypothetical protein